MATAPAGGFFPSFPVSFSFTHPVSLSLKPFCNLFGTQTVMPYAVLNDFMKCWLSTCLAISVILSSVWINRRFASAMDLLQIVHKIHTGMFLNAEKQRIFMQIWLDTIAIFRSLHNFPEYMKLPLPFFFQLSDFSGFPVNDHSSNASRNRLHHGTAEDATFSCFPACGKKIQFLQIASVTVRSW